MKQTLFVKDNRNKKLLIDGYNLLHNISPSSIDACFFDPQYRQVMEKMKYGNEGARQKKRYLLPQMDTNTIVIFLDMIAKVLKPSAYLFLWVDKFILAEGLHKDWFSGNSIYFRNTLCFLENIHEMALVDMLIWDKGRIGMGYRSRRKSEACLVYQKLPKTTKNWTDRGIPDTYTEKIENPRLGHPHKKPLGLTKRLVKCVTPKNGIVLDPCSGSFSTLDVCKETGRNFIGGDISPDCAEVEPVWK